MEHTVKVRNATETDLPTLLDMIAELAAFHGDQAILTQTDLQSLAFSEQPWITIIIAERDTTAIGYAALCPLVQLQWARKGMDIHHLFVRATFRKQGVARTLIQSATTFAAAHGCAFIAIGTHGNNTTAQRVYKACGFNLMSRAGPRFRREI